LSELIPQVNHGKSNEGCAKEVDIFAVKTNKEMTKLVNPGEGTLGDKAVFVNVFVKQTLGAWFSFVAVADIFRDVGNESMIKTDFSCEH
jgi:hypothetical protein